MTTLEINTSDIFVINKLKEYAKEKFNFEINILKTNTIEEKYYIWYEKDKRRLHKVYNEIKSWKVKMYSKDEFKDKMDLFMDNLSKKYENN